MRNVRDGFEFRESGRQGAPQMASDDHRDVDGDSEQEPWFERVILSEVWPRPRQPTPPPDERRSDGECLDL